MRGRKLLAVAGSVAALSLGAVACGDDDSTTDSGGGEDVSDASFDLTVGALLPQTGDLSIFAPPGEKAANLAAEEATAALEGTDITVELTSADTETKAAAAAAGGPAADLRRRLVPGRPVGLRRDDPDRPIGRRAPSRSR